MASTANMILYHVCKAILLNVCDAFVFTINFHENFEETCVSYTAAGMIIKHVISNEKARMTNNDIDSDVLRNMYSNAKTREQFAIEYVMTVVFKQIFDHFDELCTEVLSNCTYDKDKVLEILHRADNKETAIMRLGKILNAMRDVE